MRKCENAYFGGRQTLAFCDKSLCARARVRCLDFRVRVKRVLQRCTEVRLCILLGTIYNTALCCFFSINLFRCLDFAVLETFPYNVSQVHMI